MKLYSLAVTPNGHLEGKGSMPPPIIMHTAATPMPTPKGSPHMDSAYPFGDSRRGSNVSVDPLSFDQKSLVFFPRNGRAGKGWEGKTALHLGQVGAGKKVEKKPPARKSCCFFELRG